MQKFEEMLEERDELESRKSQVLSDIVNFNRFVKKTLIENGADEALSINWGWMNRQIHCKKRKG